VAVDSANNIYAVGYFNGTTDLGGGPRVSPGFQSYFVAKYDTTGTHVWDKAYGAGGSPSTSNGNGVALDPAGNVIASGFVSGPVDFGGGTISGTGYDITIVKLTASGGYSWARRISSVGTDTLDYGYGVVTNGAGDIFATGMYNGSSIDFGLGSRPNGGSSDAYLIRLNGTTGATIWDRQFSGTGTQQGYDVDLFGGHVFASGFLNNAGNFGGGVRTPASTDGYIVKYTDTGDYVWDKIVGGPNSDWNRALEVDPINGAIYATFDFSTTVNFGGNPRTVNGGRDNALVKWDVDGVYQWDATWGGATTGSEFAYGLTLDSSRNPIVAGGFTGTNVDFNPHPTDTFPMSSQGFTDVFVMRIMGPTGGW